MPVPGPWIQPADMWLVKDSGLTSTTAYRTIQWDTEGLDEAAVFAAYQLHWEQALEDAEGDFEAREGVDGVTLADETWIDDLTNPYSGFNSLPFESHQSWLTMLQFAVDTDTADNPMFEPDLPDGATVEYESDTGEYHDHYQFDLPADVDGTFDAGDPLKRLPNLFLYEHSMAYYMATHAGHSPWEGAQWATDFENTGAILAPFDTKTVYSTSSEVLMVPAFPVQSLVTADTDGGSAFLTLGRWGVSTPRDIITQRRYTPPRYRIIYENTSPPTLRQRHTASGNTGGPPLRQRHNGGLTGGPSLRQRQTGI